MATQSSSGTGDVPDREQFTAPLEGVVVADVTATSSQDMEPLRATEPANADGTHVDPSVQALLATTPVSQGPQDHDSTAVIPNATACALRRLTGLLQMLEESKELEQQWKVLHRLRMWHDWDKNRRQSPWKYIMSCIFSKRPSWLSHTELLSLATYFFPLRAELKVVVCDFTREFGRGRCKTSFVPLFQSDKCWSQLPSRCTSLLTRYKCGKESQRM